MYSSTCFGRPHAHHQELNNCNRNLWFYRWSVVVAMLMVVVGPAGRPEYSVPTKSRNVSDNLLNNVFFKATPMYKAGWLFGPLTSWLVGLLIDCLDDYLLLQ
jgi:hypothetical protein